MTKKELFSRRYDVGPEMLVDLLQQAMTALPTITSFQLADSGDRIDFATSFTLTSWGEKMTAVIESDGSGGSTLVVSGEPKVGIMSTPWGEEVHAATIESQVGAALDTSVQVLRTNPVVMLQADHRRVETLFVRIQAADEGGRAELVRELLTALYVHMELEENHVYPLLQREVDTDLAEEAEVEHQLARDGLAQLEELSPDEPGFDGALAMVMAGIEHHVLEEESEAFPRLVAELGPDRLAELAEQLLAARSELLERTREAGTPAPAEQLSERSSRPPRPKRATDRPRTSRKRRKQAAIDPDETTKADLVERAKKNGVSGYSSMTKAELAEALTAAR